MLIVFEGLDGAGKSTQVSLLQKRFENEGCECRFLHFPRFDAPVYGELIGEFLRGEFGAADSVDPRLVSLLYAGDRGNAAPIIRRWLNENKQVILDRYVYSNIAFQCAKIKDAEGRDKLRRRIINTEYVFFGIPKPDLSIFLDVPFEFTQRKLSEHRTGDDRNYLQGKNDVHESDLDLQRRVRDAYLEQADIDPLFVVLNCTEDQSTMKSPEKIHAEVIALLNTL
ncbi:MAG: dTMP kinase [Prevotellaceae bacterium]|jgi:dTMP kinase|nr:dTMP kinase [Prevotellaceae bacterium]